MALIAMAVWDTAENKRTDYTKETLCSLLKTVDFNKHRLIISDNGSCEATIYFYEEFVEMFAALYKNDIRSKFRIIYNNENFGTAKAINKAWALRQQGEHCIKMDNDVVINYKGWVDEMEAAIARDNKIGQVGLKRKDCWEHPKHESEDFKSELLMLPHVAGEAWIVVEKAKHIIGTCVMHSSDLLDKVGYLYQPSLYGYDDVIMSHRSHIAGFYNCFLPHINIDHIDTGATEYQDWKHKHSAEQTQGVINLVHEMYYGVKPIYYEN